MSGTSLLNSHCLLNASKIRLGFNALKVIALTFRIKPIRIYNIISCLFTQSRNNIDTVIKIHSHRNIRSIRGPFLIAYKY